MQATSAIATKDGTTSIKRNFVIATKASNSDYDGVSVAFDGTNYLVVYDDNFAGTGHYKGRDTFAQFIDESGNLVGSPLQVSGSNTASNTGVAFDGSNYLITWIDWRNDTNKDGVCDAGEGTCQDAYGQYVSKSGALVGSEFVINNDAGNQWGFVTRFNNGKYLVLVDTGVTVNDTTELFGDVYGVFVMP